MVRSLSTELSKRGLAGSFVRAFPTGRERALLVSTVRHFLILIF